MRSKNLFVLLAVLIIGCGGSGIDTVSMSRDAFPTDPVDAARDTSTPPTPSCGTRPMEYEMTLRPNGYKGVTREVVITIPNTRSPIVGGEIQTFYQVSGIWYLYSLPIYFDYRESGESNMVDYLECRNRAMGAKTFRIVAHLPTDRNVQVAMFARFHEVNRSNLFIGGAGGDGPSDPPPSCVLDLDLQCDGGACSRELLNLTVGGTGGRRVCGLRLN